MPALPQVDRSATRSAHMLAARAVVIVAARAIVFVAALSSTALAWSAALAAGDWRFAASLDGEPIGTHRFVLRPIPGDAQRRELTSVAHFDVKLLGIVVYRYRHKVEERWRGDCLSALTARTDDDGRVTDVHARATDTGLSIDVRNGDTTTAMPPADAGAKPCVMSFAYWNPALAQQSRLLDPVSGRIEAVTIREIPATSLELRGRTVSARGLRISGLTHPIDVWYVGEEWVGLDSTVDGGRRLSYRPM